MNKNKLFSFKGYDVRLNDNDHYPFHIHFEKGRDIYKVTLEYIKGVFCRASDKDRELPKEFKDLVLRNRNVFIKIFEAQTIYKSDFEVIYKENENRLYFNEILPIIKD